MDASIYKCNLCITLFAKLCVMKFGIWKKLYLWLSPPAQFLLWSKLKTLSKRTQNKNLFSFIQLFDWESDIWTMSSNAINRKLIKQTTCAIQCYWYYFFLFLCGSSFHWIAASTPTEKKEILHGLNGAFRSGQLT